jgi:hypothetical protein
MKYKYSVRIHTVSTTEELETIMNEYGSKGIRVVKVDLLGVQLVKCRQQARYTLYLEEKIKKNE